MAGTNDLTYGSHLRLPTLLSAQAPVSASHDEWLFIIQHQTSELWMKLILIELDRARGAILVGDMRPALKALERAIVVFRQLVASWDVLRTLEPGDFAAFRGELGTASGFQSWQYRLIEFRLGNRDLSQVDMHPAGSPERAVLEAECAQPSLYQAVLGHLAAAAGQDLPDTCVHRDRPYTSSAEVARLWADIYRAPDRNDALHRLGEALVRLEDVFRCWRFNHVTTVERVIGGRRGTGGTSGVGYLRRMLDVVLFPELWDLRADI